MILIAWQVSGSPSRPLFTLLLRGALLIYKHLISYCLTSGDDRLDREWRVWLHHSAYRYECRGTAGCRYDRADAAGTTVPNVERCTVHHHHDCTKGIRNYITTF